MNVIIKIEGREAIPVRAIPLLTDWKTVTPDILAAALSGDEHFFCFAAMQAYRVVNGDVVPRRWWENYVSEPLQALGDEIRATETTHKTGKEQWKCESLVKLPAGVYVWLDEFARAHQRHYGRTTLPLDVDGKDVQLADAESAKLAAKHQERIALDYAPFLNDELRALVMEGFLPGAESITMSVQDTATPAPVEAVNAFEAGLPPAEQVKAKRRTWWEVTSPYIVEIMQAGQYATAKELYNALEGKAGLDSPFDKGTGNNRYSLFIRELATTLSVKTVQNNWKELLNAAAQK